MRLKTDIHESLTGGMQEELKLYTQACADMQNLPDADRVEEIPAALRSAIGLRCFVDEPVLVQTVDLALDVFTAVESPKHKVTAAGLLFRNIGSDDWIERAGPESYFKAFDRVFSYACRTEDGANKKSLYATIYPTGLRDKNKYNHLETYRRDWNMPLEILIAELGSNGEAAQSRRDLIQMFADNTTDLKPEILQQAQAKIQELAEEQQKLGVVVENMAAIDENCKDQLVLAQLLTPKPDLEF